MNQEAVADATPAGPSTVTTNRCAPPSRPPTVHGEEHGTFGPLSSEHFVAVIVPVVVHAKLAADVNAYWPGAAVSVTLRAVDGGGGGEEGTVPAHLDVAPPAA